MGSTITVENVSKNFKDTKVLKDISLQCEGGKIYGIVGHNGSGKTVLFKCIDVYKRQAAYWMGTKIVDIEV